MRKPKQRKSRAQKENRRQLVQSGRELAGPDAADRLWLWELRRGSTFPAGRVAPVALLWLLRFTAT